MKRPPGSISIYSRPSPPENEALKKGSPLEVALKRATVQKSGASYGVAFHPPATPENPAPEVLIPETVQRGAIEIGRFEITRAQFAAFDKDYKFDAGTENYPANGITFEQAQAYCKWLSELTAETYRLPKESETVEFYKVRSGENTLDYWAGYALNPEDAQKLEDKLKNCRGMRRCCAKWEALPPRAMKARSWCSTSAETWRSG